MKFRKKPVEIEAVQFKRTERGLSEALAFCGDKLKAEESNVHTVGYFLETLEGNSFLLSDGDWIIRGIKGEFYPCKPDIFEATCEQVL